jgi:endonuclease/exonuclease/phosphatase family metal-dependent hydrolase
MNFESESLFIKDQDTTFYHPLCNLNLDNLKDKECLLNRKDNEIKILTYNIFLRPIVKNNENDWKDERLDDFLTQIKNYDIICLQEIFGAFNSLKQDLLRAATISGFFFYVETSVPSFLSTNLIDAGLIILSRFPIVSHCFTKFRYSILYDSQSEKGVLYAKIFVKNSYLHIFNTHLQASYLDSEESNFVSSYNTRMEQIAYLNKIIKKTLDIEYHKNNDKAFLLGDLNVDALGYIHKPPVNIIYYTNV